MLSEHEQSEVQLAKLERMQQYATALICRRKILLNYFNEHLDEDCGNCDVCQNPPESFDGTVLAQKALSAIARLGQSVGVNMLIDVLRGSHRQDLLSKGYHKIKTYGAGSDLSFQDWQQLIYQLLNLGLTDIAYDDKHTLKLTEASKSVLFDGKTVRLVKLASLRKHWEERKKKAKPKSQRELMKANLLQALMDLRKTIAVEKGIPPYLVLADSTLEEMASLMPSMLSELNDIKGMSAHKIQQYGQAFVDRIMAFIREQEQKGQKLRGQGMTFKLTYAYHKDGLSVQQIALKRQIKPTTVYIHLAQLYEAGADIDIARFLTKLEYQKIIHAAKATNNLEHLKELHADLNEELPYYKIRFALSYYRRHYLKQ